MDKIRILLFGTMGDIGPVVRSALEDGSCELRLVDFPQNILRDEAGYHRELRNAIRDFNPMVMLPIGEAVAMADYIGKGCLIPSPISNAACLRLLSSKVQFSRLAGGLSIPRPETLSIDEAADRQGDVIFKRDISFGGHGVHRPRNQESLLHLIEHQKAGEPFLIEEYVDGEDFSVDAVRINGYFRAESYKSLSSQGHGPSSERLKVRSEVMENWAKSILDHVDYTGTCGFDFKVRADGSAVILEANPRFTGGIATQIASGFNIPKILVQETLRSSHQLF